MFAEREMTIARGGRSGTDLPVNGHGSTRETTPLTSLRRRDARYTGIENTAVIKVTVSTRIKYRGIPSGRIDG